MSYTVSLTKHAERQADRLPRAMKRRVRLAIDGLAENPRPAGYLKLTNRDAYRIRVGDYRVIYRIQDDRLIVTVIQVGHRSDVYR